MNIREFIGSGSRVPPAVLAINADDRIEASGKYRGIHWRFELMAVGWLPLISVDPEVVRRCVVVVDGRAR
jgi:hypothetical protein